MELISFVKRIFNWLSISQSSLFRLRDFSTQTWEINSCSRQLSVDFGEEEKENCLELHVLGEMILEYMYVEFVS